MSDNVIRFYCFEYQIEDIKKHVNKVFDRVAVATLVADGTVNPINRLLT